MIGPCASRRLTHLRSLSSSQANKSTRQCYRFSLHPVIASDLTWRQKNWSRRLPTWCYCRSGASARAVGKTSGQLERKWSALFHAPRPQFLGFALERTTVSDALRSFMRGRGFEML